MVTHTAIPYWLSLPLGDLYAWSGTVRQVQDEDAPPERAE
jgi:hypothetical protein